MAVTLIEKIGDGWSFKTTGWPNPSIEFTDVYRVTTDNAQDGGYLVSTAFPAFGTPHDEHTAALLIEGTFDKVPNEMFVWTGRLRYSSAPSEVNDNPLAQPVKRRWSSIKTMQVADKDRNGTIVLSKARIQYDPPLEKIVPHATLTFTRNEAAFSGATALDFVGRLNGDPFSGAAPGTLLIDEITAEEAFWNGESYWVVSYAFAYNPDGWQPLVLEQSLMELKEGKLARIKDKNGEDVTQPVPIDDNGAAIPPSSLPTAAKRTQWDIYEEVSVGSLGLPA